MADMNNSNGAIPERPVWRWFKRIVLAVLALFVVLVGIIVLVGTGPVLRQLTPWINKTVSDAVNGTFVLGRVEGSLWGQLDVSGVTLEMPETGLAVQGDDLVFAWSPWALFGAKVDIDRISASHMAVTLPDRAGPETPVEPEDETGSGFVLPVSVKLGTLEIPDIQITNPVDGRVFSYQLNANASASQNLSAVLGVNLQPRDGGVDHIRANLDFDADAQKLKADIDAKLDRTGLVMALAGLNPDEAPDVTLLLKGRGPANDWHGDLTLTASDLAKVAGAVNVQLGENRNIGFGLDVAATTLGQLASALPAPLQGDVGIKTAGRYDGEHEKLEITSLNVTRDKLLALKGSADIDLANSQIDAELTSDIDGAASTLIDDAATWQGMQVTAHASGDLAMPDVDAEISARNVKTPVSHLETLVVNAKLVPTNGDFAVQASAQTTGHTFDDQSLGAMVGTQQDVTINASAPADFSQVTVDDFTLKTPTLSANGQAVIDAQGNVNQASLHANIQDLVAFAPISGMDLQGQGTLDISDAAWNMADGGKANIVLQTADTGFGIAELDHVVGSSPAIEAAVTISPKMDLMVDVNSVKTANVNGGAKLAITNDFNTLSLDADLALAPGIVPPSVPVSLKDKAGRLTVRLNGPLAEPQGDIRLVVPMLGTSGEAFKNVNLTSHMAWQHDKTGKNAPALQLENTGKFDWRGAPYHLDADVGLPASGLEVSNISLTGEHIDLTGRVTLPGNAVPLSGNIALTRFDAMMAQGFGVPFANGKITASLDFSAKNAAQHITASLSAKGLRMVDPQGIETTRLDDVAIDGTIENAFADPELDLKVSGTDIGVPEARVEKISATIKGVLAKLQTTVKAQAMVQNRIPVKLDAAAEIALSNDISVTANKLNADVGTQHIALRQPLVFRQGANGSLTADAMLSIGKGQLDAKLDLAPGKSFEATADIKSLVLGPWGAMFDVAGLDGTLTLNADAHEKPGKPASANIDGKISDISVAAAAQLPPLALNLTASLRDGGVSADVDMGRPDMRIITATAKLPVDVSFLKGQFAVSPDQPLSAQVKMDGEIGQFWPYVPLPDHALAGEVKLNASVDGTLSDPQWKGTVSLRDGRYEHMQYGTLVQDIVLDGVFNNDGFKLTKLTADDGGQGTLTGKADVELGDGINYTANITMRNMAITRMDELRVWTDVDVDVKGDENKADIESKTTLRRGEVDLSVALPASVPELDVQNLAKTQTEEQKRDDADKGGFVANLNARVDVPGRLFVRGKGLDSEWGGHLDITGRADNPKIVGELRALRGQLDLIGKTFVIKDSKITFSGAQPPDPLLDIAGVYTTDDLTVTASLSGPANDPQLSLSSEPALPQDEILSQVLFGKSQGSLSAVEAVQLANAAAQLSGSGGGLDVIGSIRNFIGADVLRVDGGDEGPTVKAGKYLTDDIYVGTKQGTTPGSSGVEVEIELSPHIKITTETSEIDSKAGIQFKLDY
ncbi:translocation/assembly module TamB domain-containing protein [Thalassospira sp. MCCC 1A01428]|uniref:translocation/assembly module TamB domain-containing protein n=1 Tax=Thalassospira sp. MCCC 1A01428 TaxID=1470575 RepID=UPI000A1F72CC|nr:translocation/assembly module TamB domain-containing protein [Thalassospira sp. MCCC 1A01428]